MPDASSHDIQLWFNQGHVVVTVTCCLIDFSDFLLFDVVPHGLSILGDQ